MTCLRPAAVEATEGLTLRIRSHDACLVQPVPTQGDTVGDERCCGDIRARASVFILWGGLLLSCVNERAGLSPALSSGFSGLALLALWASRSFPVTADLSAGGVSAASLVRSIQPRCVNRKHLHTLLLSPEEQNYPAEISAVSYSLCVWSLDLDLRGLGAIPSPLCVTLT
jgi:hypothetical protein